MITAHQAEREAQRITATQTEFTATDAGIPVASQELSLTAGPSALDRLLAWGRIRGGLAMLGPAFVASVAHVDPGNFATNIQGGAQYGYLLLWVVLAANLMAMVVQYLSAKLGIVTGRALPELVRDRLPRPATWGMWVQGEVVAMATDVAEFIGAALGLNLLFGVPMLPATESYLGVSSSTKVGMMGYSGGAIATEWASELAPSYAPTLRIIGAAAGGVPVDFAAAP
jgi:hypothetical protein